MRLDLPFSKPPKVAHLKYSKKLVSDNGRIVRRIYAPKLLIRKKTAVALGDSIIRDAEAGILSDYCDDELLSTMPICGQVEHLSRVDCIPDPIYEDAESGLSGDEDNLDIVEEIAPGRASDIQDTMGELHHDVLVASGDLRGKINTDRYYATWKKTGVLTCRLKENLCESMSDAAKQARIDLKKYPCARHLYNSISCTIGVYTFDQRFRRISEWCNWHSHWISRTTLNVQVRPSYPTRNDAHSYLQPRNGAAVVTGSTAVDDCISAPNRIVVAEPSVIGANLVDADAPSV